MKAIRNWGIKLGLISPTLREAQSLFQFRDKPKSLKIQSNTRLKFGSSIHTVSRVR